MKLRHALAIVTVLAVLTVIGGSAWGLEPRAKVLILHTATATATSDGTAMGVLDYGAVGVQNTITASWDGTLTYEITLNNTTWVAVNCYNPTTKVLATTTVAAAAYVICPVIGAERFRARVSGRTVGTVTATASSLALSAGALTTPSTAGGGTGEPAGVDGNLQTKSGVNFAAYGGTTCFGDAVSALDASGLATCGTTELSWKDAVRVATTANGTLATAFEDGDVIDGVTLIQNDRILIKNQTLPAANGIYIVQSSGAPTRASDLDQSAEFNGAVVSVTSGTVNANRIYIQTSVNPTVETTAINWSQVNNPSAPNTARYVTTRAEAALSNEFSLGTLTTGLLAHTVSGAVSTPSSGGSGAANKVAYWSSASALTSTTLFHFDGTNLGIGTASPTTPLFVQVDQNSQTDITVKNAIALGNASARARISVISFDSSGTLAAFPSDFTSAWLQDRFALKAGSDASGITFDAVSAGQDIRFFAGNTTEKMRLTDAGLLGIGTTTPVDLVTTNNASGFAGLGATGTGDGTNYAGVRLRANIATDRDWFLTHHQDLGANEFLIQTALSPFSTYTTVATFQTDGDVGIGTTAPDERLHIAKTSANVGFVIEAVTTGNTPFIQFQEAGTVRADVFYEPTANNFTVRAVEAGSLMTFHTANTERVRIDAAGDVGINVADPTFKLDVSGTIRHAALTAASGTPNSLCIVAATKEVTENAALTCTVSTRQAKMNIAPFPTTYNERLLQQLTPVEFAYRDYPERVRWGFIAEDVQAVDPKLGDAYTSEGEAHSIDIPAMLALIVKTLQEHHVLLHARVP